MSQPDRVLLADDEEAFLKSAAELFRRAGYACDCVSDAAAAAKAMEHNRYDVFVADIFMKGNENLELVRDIKQRFPDLPVILITGQPTVGTAVEALRLAAIDYITKPMDFAELRERVDSAIKMRRAQQSVEEKIEEFGPVVEKLRSIHQSLAAATNDGTPPRELGAAAGQDHATGPTTIFQIAGDARKPHAPGNAPTPCQELGEQLSPREREILEAVAAGQRVSSIARGFSISPYTVRNHLKAIFRKLGVHSQVELLAQLHARERRTTGNNREPFEAGGGI